MVKVSGAPEEIQLSAGATCREILSKALSGKKFKEAVACRCEARLYDLASEVDEQCGVLEPVQLFSQEGLKVLRHSAAHIMAEAVKTIFPSARVTIGPDIEHGFYYDFDYERPFTPEDLEKIEARMAQSIAQDQPFERVVMSREEARKVFLDLNETYKLEILDELEEEQVSLYRHGEFIDLCRGPHVPSTGYVKSFKLTSVAGAYWRGDENRPMLQRIYGTAFAAEKDLKKHLARLEEARKRDHRKLGAQLDLFSFSEEAGPGMPIFHPKGALIRTILEDFERKEHLRRGYQIVQGPQILRKELWEKSGHYDNYRENMYFTRIDEQVYGVKPMNCLSHMLIYKSRLRSYRDLPLRYFELGRVHRHEKSGVLHGLLRVREFTQDDAHILCRPDQLQDEISGVVNFVRDVMGLFGFEYVVEVSTRPEKSIGSGDAWEKATTALTNALDAMGMPYGINPGDGAFYGPKIDIKLKDALDRKWQCATVQCDFTLPERFDLTYTGEDGKKYRPVMLHRVILGAIERFMGVLIEHYGGAFPTWLAPVQARLMNITDAQSGYIHDCADRLRQMGIRVEVDDRNEKLGYKVREAQMEKIPYVLVAGDQEVLESGLNVRLRGGKNLGLMSIQEVVDHIFHDMDEPFKKGGLSYRYLY